MQAKFKTYPTTASTHSADLDEKLKQRHQARIFDQVVATVDLGSR